MVEKLDYTNSPLDDKYLDIPKKEIIEIHDRIVEAYEKLRRYGVRPVWDEKQKKNKNKDDDLQIPLFDEFFAKNENKTIEDKIIEEYCSKELQLIFLAKYRRKCVHKDLISAFVQKYKQNVALDQQVRHLSTQYHWNILNKGAEIPDEDEKVPSGYYYLVSLDQPNPNILFEEMKRKGRLAAETFDDLKIIYGHKCATCGREEGEIDERNGGIRIKLQQGHIDPSKELDVKNTIPQCQYCNQTYGNNFLFNEHGRVIAIYEPKIVLESPVFVQEEMIRLLLKEREKRENKSFQ